VVRLHPLKNSRWYARVTRAVLDAAAEAEKAAGDKRSKELVSTIADLRILANLALYHSRRIHAALAWSFYRHSRDLNALDDAIRHEASAIEAWRAIVEAAGDLYHHDLMFGRRSAGLSGHWKDELAALERGLERLKDHRAKAYPAGLDAGPRIASVPVRRALPGQPIMVRATIGARGGVRHPELLVLASGGKKAIPMKKTGDFRYAAEIPAAEVAEGLRYSIQARDAAGHVFRWPDEPVAVTVTSDNDPPTLAHTPITRAPAQTPLTITATVRDPSGVELVRLRYRSVTQFDDYRTLEMQPTGNDGEYRATVPGEHIPAKWDFMYFFEVMDRVGNGCIYPNFEKETPYIIVRLDR